MNRMTTNTKLFILFLVCAGVPQVGRAQETFREAYDKFRQQARKDYENFRDEANRHYAEFLKGAWTSYEVIPAVPKPWEKRVPPVVKDDDKGKDDKSGITNPRQRDKDKDQRDKDKGNKDKDKDKGSKGKDGNEGDKGQQLKIDGVVAPPQPSPQPVPVAPVPENDGADGKKVSFTCYGTAMEVRFSDEECFRLTDISKSSLSDAWSRLSGKAYNNTLRDALLIRAERKLNDWAYLTMLQRLAEACLGKGNEATLLTAFLYCQSGYKMRLGIDGSKLHALFATEHAIYKRPFFRVGGDNLYPLDTTALGMSIIDLAFPNEKKLSLYIHEEADLAYRPSDRRTIASKRYPDVSITCQVNRNLIDFYNDYPTSELGDRFMTCWEMYANTPLEQRVKQQIYPTLKEKLKGLGEEEAATRLLNLVQTGFVYEYDSKVWGEDRAFFAEETLYYPYCDCEDRSILFSRLVRDLLGLDVVLIYYPGHLASAVCFKSSVSGDYILLNGRRFIICDPTYIGAPVGETMPDMDNQTATVILLE